MRGTHPEDNKKEHAPQPGGFSQKHDLPFGGGKLAVDHQSLTVLCLNEAPFRSVELDTVNT